MKNNLERVIDKLFIYFIIFYILFWRWFVRFYYQAYIIVYIFCIAYILASVLQKKIIRTKIRNVISTIVLIVFILIIYKGNSTNITYNLFQQLIPSFLALCIFVQICSRQDRKKVLNILLERKISIFLNVYFWINSIIIYIQSLGTYFMMNGIEGGNTFYTDNVTGFIGNSGTHVLCFYYMILIEINLRLFYLTKNEKTKHKIFILLFVECIIMIWQSTLNDNNMFFLVIIYELVLILYRNRESLKKKKRFTNVLIIVAILVVTAGIVILNSEELQIILRNRVLYQFQIYNAWLYTGNSNSSAERFTLIIYSWENIKDKLFGNGLGAVIMHYPINFIKHFGMNDASSFLYLGGLSMLFLVPFYYYKGLKKIIKKANGGINIILIVSIIILMIYTQPFSELSLTLEICLLCFIIRNNGMGRDDSKSSRANEFIEKNILVGKN